MFQGEDVFKFYVYEHNVFFLEKLMSDNQIEFHNELILGTNINSTKYYIKNSDRKKLDKLLVNNDIEIFIDSIPRIETRFPEIKISLPIILIILVLILLFIVLLK